MLAMFKPNPVFRDHEGIFKIDPVAKTMEFLHVDNWPVKQDSHIYQNPPTSVYIPKLNRIYSFGGRSISVSNSSDERELDDIFYIELSPLSPKKQAGNGTITVDPSTELVANNQT